MAKKTSQIRKPAHATAGTDAAPAARKPAPANPAAGKRTALWPGVALALVTLAVYGQVITHQFISLDDDLYITNNPMVSAGLTLKGIGWAFTAFHAANWHPLTWLSHMLDSQVFGLAAGWHQLVNVLIHVANTLLLYVFLKRVTGALWPSAMVAALFALHPLHVESVAWAAERKDVLSTFFGLLALLAYARYAQAPSPKRYVLVALWLALGLMAKPMLVTWPFVLLLLDYWPLGRLAWKPAAGLAGLAKPLWPLLREKLPLFALVVGSIILTYLAQSRGGAVRALVDAPFSLRLANALVSYAEYILLTFWPGGLAVYYPFSPDNLPAWKITGAALLLAAITVVAVRQAGKRPCLIVGWLWFLGTLVPVIGLVQVGGQAMADRYHYLPSIGLFIALVFGLAETVARRAGRASVAAAVVVLLLLGVRTWTQVRLWRDSVTLFTHTLSVTSNNLVIEYNLAHVLGRQGRYDEAATHFAEALRIAPDFYDALINMGTTLADQGKPAEAVGYYDRALRVQPNSGKAHMQMAVALAAQGKMSEALPHFYKAAELAPNDADVRTNLGLAMARQGKLQEATEQLNEALRLNPNSAEAHNNLGLVLLAAGKPEESAAHFSTALRLKPGLTTAQENLKRAQAQIAARQK